MQLSAREFELVVMLAAALLALWFVVRFPKIGPSTPWAALVHFAIAYVGGSAVLGPATGFLRGLPVPDSLVVAIVLGILPPVIYLFVSLAWFIRNIQRLVGAYR